MDDLNFNIDDLFKDEAQDADETEEVNDTPSTETTSNSETADVREKIEKETEDRIAKDLGYENYSAMQKAKEKKLLEDAGLDDAEMEELINKLVEKRLSSDPRIKKLEKLERTEQNNFVKAQLDEINSLTDKTYTRVDQLPQDVLALWEKTGNLKQAYLAVKGEELLRNKSRNEKGSLTHLANINVGSTRSKTRGLTEEEKAIYKMVMPDITDEELSKKTKLVD